MWSALRAGVLLLGTAITISACAPAKLVGDPLPGALAPDFTLTDGPTGEAVSLSSLQGHVILLTFLYTTCPDSCPLTAEIIRSARDRIGSAATSVSLIAVSVDPKGALARVWQDYGIAQAVSSPTVLHSDVLYLIDKKGRGRILLHSTVAPDVLASDLSLLVSER
jgi:cytochrome oxidase Cu insertion factor (SCO1/SenC/PrrC family)